MASINHYDDDIFGRAAQQQQRQQQHQQPLRSADIRSLNNNDSNSSSGHHNNSIRPPLMAPIVAHEDDAEDVAGIDDGILAPVRQNSSKENSVAGVAPEGPRMVVAPSSSNSSLRNSGDEANGDSVSNPNDLSGDAASHSNSNSKSSAKNNHSDSNTNMNMNSGGVDVLAHSSGSYPSLFSGSPVLAPQMPPSNTPPTALMIMRGSAKFKSRRDDEFLNELSRSNHSRGGSLSGGARNSNLNSNSNLDASIRSHKSTGSFSKKDSVPENANLKSNSKPSGDRVHPDDSDLESFHPLSLDGRSIGDGHGNWNALPPLRGHDPTLNGAPRRIPSDLIGSRASPQRTIAFQQQPQLSHHLLLERERELQADFYYGSQYYDYYCYDTPGAMRFRVPRGRGGAGSVESVMGLAGPPGAASGAAPVDPSTAYDMGGSYSPLMTSSMYAHSDYPSPHLCGRGAVMGGRSDGVADARTGNPSASAPASASASFNLRARAEEKEAEYSGGTMIYPNDRRQLNDFHSSTHSSSDHPIDEEKVDAGNGGVNRHGSNSDSSNSNNGVEYPQGHHLNLHQLHLQQQQQRMMHPAMYHKSINDAVHISSSLRAVDMRQQLQDVPYAMHYPPSSSPALGSIPHSQNQGVRVQGHLMRQHQDIYQEGLIDPVPRSNERMTVSTQANAHASPRHQPQPSTRVVHSSHPHFTGSMADNHTSNSSDNTSTHSRSHAKSRSDKRVSFSILQIRTYETILGDNPSCSGGPSLALGWRYDPSHVTAHIDDYERLRATLYGDYDCRPEDLVLHRFEREAILLNTGYSRHDIAESVRGINKVKNRRRQTVHNLPVAWMEERMEVCRRTLRRVMLKQERTRHLYDEWRKNSQGKVEVDYAGIKGALRRSM